VQQSSSLRAHARSALVLFARAVAGASSLRVGLGLVVASTSALAIVARRAPGLSSG
jgi:hypothetical protein